jgi:cardiolipin synthase
LRRPRCPLSALCALGLWALAGCSSLPHIVPDLARRPTGTAQVQLVGAGGPLPAARRQAVLARLQAGGVPTDIFDRHLAVEEALVGSPLTTGNRLRLLQDGPATYEAMLAAIASARDHVHMETYILDDDEVGRRFAQALIGKRSEGVPVRVLRDSVGTRGTPAAFFERLAAAGVQVLVFNPANPLQALEDSKDWAPNQRDHRKLLIVDGTQAFLGGINISSVYSGGSTGRNPRPRPDGSLAWRDTDVQVEGPAVVELQKLFLAAWAQQRGEPPAAGHFFPARRSAGREVVRVIGSSPTEPFSLIYATLLSAIDSAETSVQITNAYFVPDPQLLEALEAASRRGVAVTLILPSQTDSWLVFQAGRQHYDRLLAAGVRIFERRGAVLHSKTALIDGVWSTVGSTNLDWRSFLHNHELNIVVLGPDFGGQVQAMFERDLALSDAVDLTRWRQRGLGTRLKEGFARLWEYWL